MMITPPGSNVAMYGSKLNNQTFTANPPKITNSSSFVNEEAKAKYLLHTLQKVDNKELNQLMVLLMSEDEEGKTSPEKKEKIQQQFDKVAKDLSSTEKDELKNCLRKTVDALKDTTDKKRITMKEALTTGNCSTPCVIGAALYFGAPTPEWKAVGAIMFWLSLIFVSCKNGGGVL